MSPSRKKKLAAERTPQVHLDVQGYEIPPMRAKLPTLPYDLSEYARIHTGPESWSARSGEGGLPLFLDDEVDSLFDGLGLVAGPLIGVRKGDVPRLAVVPGDHPAFALDPREASIVALLDGQSSVQQLLDMSGLAEPEFLAVLCDLCTRGILTLSGPEVAESTVLPRVAPAKGEPVPAPGKALKETG